VTATAFVDIALRNRDVSIEYRWLSPTGRSRAGAPLVVFLHEGLGSVAMWRDYPQRLCDAGGYRGLVYSRPGYGRSTPRARGEQWPVSFMHEHANDVLPRLLAGLGIGVEGPRPWLFGHSDGASIALIYAATHPAAVAGVIAVAPHIIVEPLSLQSIRVARDAYVTGGLKARLARYHDDVDSAFHGWNDAWLAPAFAGWSIESLLGSLRCPILAVQGADDEYGTLAQVAGIRRHAAQTEVVVIPACGHSPQKDAPQALTAAAIEFITRHSPALISQGGVQ
jgi:pimeloyl-ACP methyl ester carboxylesterase